MKGNSTLKNEFNNNHLGWLCYFHKHFSKLKSIKLFAFQCFDTVVRLFVQFN